MSALRGTNGLAADFRRGERLLRACAWQDDDILCQIALGDLYGDGVFPAMAETYSRPGRDPREALVWYFIALVNVELHDASERKGRHFEVFNKRIRKGCDTAYLSVRKDPAALEDVQNRITYIYRSRGASGWYQMGDILTGALEKSIEGKRRAAHEKSQRSIRWPNTRSNYKPGNYKDKCLSLYEQDFSEARLHFLEATQNGHPFAEDAILDAEEALLRMGVVSNRYASSYGHSLLYPPFKLSNPEATADHGKVPARYLTDESDTQLENEPELNRLAAKKPYEKRYLTNTALSEVFPTLKTRRIEAFREQLNFRHSATTLSPWEIVLALKLAANSDDNAGTMSANLLGEMYFNGIGVPREMERARYAFEIAAFKDTALVNEEPHGQAALHAIVELLEQGDDALDQSDIDKNAVRNLCLILADDTRFPNHRVLADLYLQILSASDAMPVWQPKSKAASIKDCKDKLVGQ